jgi:hypothetical protein
MSYWILLNRKSCSNIIKWHIQGGTGNASPYPCTIEVWSSLPTLEVDLIGIWHKTMRWSRQWLMLNQHCKCTSDVLRAWLQQNFQANTFRIDQGSSWSTYSIHIWNAGMWKSFNILLLFDTGKPNNSLSSCICLCWLNKFFLSFFLTPTKYQRESVIDLQPKLWHYPTTCVSFSLPVYHAT